jgi:hypothetical protein
MSVRSLEYSRSSTALALLPHRFREYLSGRRVGFGRACSRTALPPLALMGDVIRVHTNAVIAANVPWDAEQARLQTIRAVDSFHHKPFNDCVAIEVTRSGVRAQRPVRGIEHAQLLMLLQARLPDEQTGVLQWEPLAYVRWFKAVPEPDVLCEFGAVRLAWDKVQDTAAGKYRCRESLVPLSAIVRRVYVVQDFSCAPRDVVGQADSESEGSEVEQHPRDAALLYRRFHVSPFKW